jgi:predicted enzyme related to lactoylglutathione lyase
LYGSATPARAQAGGSDQRSIRISRTGCGSPTLVADVAEQIGRLSGAPHHRQHQVTIQDEWLDRADPGSSVAPDGAHEYHTWLDQESPSEFRKTLLGVFDLCPAHGTSRSRTVADACVLLRGTDNSVPARGRSAPRTPVRGPSTGPRPPDRGHRAAGGVMSDSTETAVEDLAWPPSLTPYITVSDARRAMQWYADVFDATRRGEPYEMPDGSIGHAELAIGDAVLMLSEGSSQVPVQPPAGDGPFSHTIHVQVDDVDSTVQRARQGGAAVEREPTDESYGRIAVIVDPFGHRWMLNKPPGRAARQRHGDVAHVTLAVPDGPRAGAFYGAVLGWRVTPTSTSGDWGTDRTQPMVGLTGAGGGAAEVRLCYRVGDLDAALRRVRDNGGQAAQPQRMPYGLLAECVDDQGIRFELWQPTD